jgi:histidyl-tRNA synthetase
MDKVGPTGVRLELRAVGLPTDLLNRERQAVGRWLRGQADRARLLTDLSAALDNSATDSAARTVKPFLDALADWPNGGGTDETVATATEAVMEASISALRAETPQDQLVPEEAADRLLALLTQTGDSRALLAAVGARLDDPEARQGVRDMTALLDALDAAGVPSTKVAVDFGMVRGLDYYTGTIFETVVSDPPIGSITGGGRFDRLVGLFGKELPAVGTSFGVDRLVDVMETAGLFPPELLASATQVLVVRFADNLVPDAIALGAALRAAGIATEVYFEADSVGDQVRYALKRGIPFVAIVGPDEQAAGTVMLRDLARSTQTAVPRAELAAVLRDLRAAPAGTGHVA